MKVTDIEMIKWLRDFCNVETCTEDYENCKDCHKYSDCYMYAVIQQIADRFEQLTMLAQNGDSSIYTNVKLIEKYTELEKKYNRLKQMVDDSTMDHVCDYLEWYYEDNERLKAENDRLKNNN